MPGSMRIRIAASPVMALRPHQPLPPPVLVNGASAAHWNLLSPGSMEALVVEDGAATATVKVPVTAAVPVTVIGSGFGEQVTPGGKFAVGQVTFTTPVKPPVGVTVIVDGPLMPAETAAAVPPIVKEPLLVTVTVAFPAPEEEEPE